MYFENARTALYFGLCNIGITAGDEILIPDYICISIIAVLEEMDVEYKYYFLSDDLSPNWNSVHNVFSIKTKAILMVHYFGFLQDFDRFKEFCDRKNIFLIEDMAHGYNLHTNKQLGKSGDIVISSPRKSFGLQTGGYLGIKKKLVIPTRNLKRKKINLIHNFLYLTLKRSYFLKAFLRKLVLKRSKFQDRGIETFDKNNFFLIDKFSEKKIHSTDLISLIEKRREIFKIWGSFSRKHDLQAVFSHLGEGINPLCFPFFVDNENLRDYWINWGWENGFIIYPWPTLPDEVYKGKYPGYFLFKKILCFPIDISMNPIRLSLILNKEES